VSRDVRRLASGPTGRTRSILVWHSTNVGFMNSF
jgi:hypothetical protein